MKHYFNAAALALALTASATAMAAEQNLLSVHVLNQQTGLSASEVEVMLEQKQGESWKVLNTANTNQQGRIDALWPAKPFEAGDYRVIFKTGHYFAAHQQQSFFTEIPVEFHITNTTTTYHIPLLLSQYGYSTYRGS